MGFIVRGKVVASYLSPLHTALRVGEATLQGVDHTQCQVPIIVAFGKIRSFVFRMSQRLWKLFHLF
jgi:hypothetical protein